MESGAACRPANPMLRVGYPAILAAELLHDFPAEVEIIPLPDDLDHEIEIDVWIPDPYPTRAMRIWPHLRGVRLVLSLMAGTEWIPRRVGPHVTICNARGAHNISTAEWTVGRHSGHAEVLSALSRRAARGRVEAPLRGQRALREHHRRCAGALSARDAGRADRQDRAAGGLRRHRQGDRANARALSCRACARGPQRAHDASSCRQRTRQPFAASGNRDSDSALDR